MHDPPRSELSSEDALRWLDRLRQRDPLAPAEFAAAFLRLLIAWLQRTHPGVDPMLCEEAADEAIVCFLLDPEKYKPQELELEAFLRMAARRDLQNLLRKERRHHQHRRDWIVVEQSAEDGKYLQREDDPSLPLQIDEARRQQAPPEAMRQPLTEVERRFWEQMQQGERRHAVFAGILGVTHLPLKEQKRQVKRVKDRLKKRVERAGGKDGRST